jgi:glycerol kinase
MQSMPDPTPSFFLALDQGSHASKAFLFDGDGRVLGAGERPLATRHPHEGWVEHDAEAVLASLRGAIDEALAAAAVADAAMATGTLVAGLAVQRSSVVCWDRDSGRALSPVLSWQDRRHAGWLAALALDSRRVCEITGLVVSPHYGASKLRWCLDELPEVRAAARAGRLCMGPLASFLTSRLLGERPCVVDPANAARTLLYDIAAGDWSDELLQAFDIPRACLPRCVPTRGRFGTLATGAGEGGGDGAATLRVLTGDQPAALFAWGEPAPDNLYVNIGTGAFVQRISTDAPPQGDGMLRGVVLSDGARQLCVSEGTVNGAGAALAWLAAARETSVERLVEEAPRWLEAVREPPLFMNGVGGLGAPFWRPDCPVKFSMDAPLAAETVAVIESIVFLLQANIERLSGGTEQGAPAQRIVVTGGLSRLDGLCRRLAALAGMPVERPGEVEATARGLAWLLGVRVGQPATPETFAPQAWPELRARYERWRRFMDDVTGHLTGHLTG